MESRITTTTTAYLSYFVMLHSKSTKHVNNLYSIEKIYSLKMVLNSKTLKLKKKKR